MQRVFDGMKPTPAERLWTATHLLYNRRLGFSFLNIAIENLAPDTWYVLRIKVESVAYDNRISPIIDASGGKGTILADWELVDLRGNVKRGVPVKMLGLNLKQDETAEVKFRSTLGLLSVFYECDYFDAKIGLHMREACDTGSPYFAMIRQIVNDHMVRYRCKSPVGESFNAMVFTVEWIEDSGG